MSRIGRSASAAADPEARSDGPPAGTQRWNRLIPLMFLTVALCGGARLWLPQYRQWSVVRDVQQAGGEADWQPAPRSGLEELLPEPLLRGFHDRLVLDLKHVATDDGLLCRLGDAPRLDTLILRGRRFSDAGLGHLAQCAGLRWLYLIDCPQLSPGAVSRLQAALPGLDIQQRGAAFLGVSGVPAPGGLALRDVQHDSPAWRAGLLPGDVIRQAGGQPVADFDTLVEIIGRHAPGDTLPLQVERHGQPFDIRAVLDGWK